MAVRLVLRQRLVPVTGNKYLRLIDDLTSPSSPHLVVAILAQPTVEV